MWGGGAVICILSRMLYRVGALAEDGRVEGRGSEAGWKRGSYMHPVVEDVGVYGSSV